MNPTKKQGVNSGAQEGEAVSAQLVALWIHEIKKDKYNVRH